MKLKTLPKSEKKSLNINVWNYLEDYSKNKKKILDIVNKVFNSGNLILSNEVKNFENNFSKTIRRFNVSSSFVFFF